MALDQMGEEECLFHCANLQGVILGVGLTMLEQYFHDESSSASETVEKSASGKRRKSSTPLASHTLDIDDDDDAYPLPSGKGKKAKLGIGYAGDVREDVRNLDPLTLYSWFTVNPEHRPTRGSGSAETQRSEAVDAPRRHSSLPALSPPCRWWEAE
jgi:hypothetical protein